jgi:hypothetical protein
VASRTAARTVSRLRRPRPRMLYLKEITSPCFVILMLPSSVPVGWDMIAW